jgi:hypothetical protein
MTRHTRKRKHTEHVQTIPELRRAFEHIEEVGQRLCRLPTGKAVAEFQKEWKKTFHRDLSKQAAEAYLDHVKKEQSAPSQTKRKTRRLRGGASALGGAPLDYTLRPGINLVDGGVNQNSYAVTPKFVDGGFWNPEPAQSYDPVPGQTRYVTHVPAGMGTNAFPQAFGMKGGKNKSKKANRKLRGGALTFGQAIAGASLDQAFMRPFAMSNPPTPLQDATSMFRGQQVGQSPDPTQTRLNYMMAPNARPAPDLSVSSIKVDLKTDINAN